MAVAVMKQDENQRSLPFATLLSGVASILSSDSDPVRRDFETCLKRECLSMFQKEIRESSDVEAAHRAFASAMQSHSSSQVLLEAQAMVVAELKEREASLERVVALERFLRRSPDIEYDALKRYMQENQVSTFIKGNVANLLENGRVQTMDGGFVWELAASPCYLTKEKSEKIVIHILRMFKDTLLSKYINFASRMYFKRTDQPPETLRVLLHTCWQGDVIAFCDAFERAASSARFCSIQALLRWMTFVCAFADGLRNSLRYRLVRPVLKKIIDLDIPTLVFAKAMELRGSNPDLMSRAALEELLPCILKDITEMSAEHAQLLREIEWKSDAMKVAVGRHVPDNKRAREDGDDSDGSDDRDMCDDMLYGHDP